MRAMSEHDDVGATLAREFAAATAELAAPAEWPASIARRAGRRRAVLAGTAALGLASAAAVTVAVARPGAGSEDRTGPSATGYQLVGFEPSPGANRAHLPCMPASAVKLPRPAGESPFSFVGGKSSKPPRAERPRPALLGGCVQFVGWLARALPDDATPLTGSDDAWVQPTRDGVRTGFVRVESDRVAGFRYLAIRVGGSVSDADLLAELEGSQQTVRVVRATPMSGPALHHS